MMIENGKRAAAKKTERPENDRITRREANEEMSTKNQSSTSDDRCHVLCISDEIGKE